jgi:hypothetical protein
MDSLAAVVGSLDPVRAFIREFGCKHAASYGVRPEHLWAQALQPDFYPETRQAWKAVLEEIKRGMRVGAEP